MLCAHDKQTSSETAGESNDMTDINAEFGASYASDVQGVVSLYSTLLFGTKESHQEECQSREIEQDDL